MKIIKKMTASVIAGSLLVATALPAQAGLITPQQALAPTIDNRADLYAFFDRTDVQSELIALGVTPEQAKARVNSMTPTEVENLRNRIAEEPAGAGVLGVLFSVFVILLVTDILGLTKVFPFTRSVR